MSKTQNFSVHSYDNLNEKVYRHKTSQTHIFHSLEWMKIIHDAFGIKYKVAMIKEKDEILASIPFVTYRNLLKGPCALPLQFSGYYGSIIADNEFFKKKIINNFYNYCKKFKLYTQIPEVNEIEGYQSFFGYSVYKIEIDKSLPVEEQILIRASKRSKSYTKKAIKSDLKSLVGGLELLDQFYLLYLQNMKELGTPPLTKTYFKKIFEYLPRFARIILVIKENHVCSSILTIKVSENELFAPFISTPRKYQKHESSYLVYLEAVKEAQNLGCSVMNFGRSIDGSGPALFKQRYGLKVVPLYMYSPHKNWSVTNPEKSFLRYAVAIWKKLPIPITRVGGVILGKHLI